MSNSNPYNNPPHSNNMPGFSGPPSIFPPGVNQGIAPQYHQGNPINTGPHSINQGGSNKIPLNGPSNPQVQIPNFPPNNNLVPNVPALPNFTSGTQNPPLPGNFMNLPAPGFSTGINPLQPGLYQGNQPKPSFGLPVGVPHPSGLPLPPGLPPPPGLPVGVPPNSGLPPPPGLTVGVPPALGLPIGLPQGNQPNNMIFPPPASKPQGNFPPVPAFMQQNMPNVPQFPPPGGFSNLPPMPAGAGNFNIPSMNGAPGMMGGMGRMGGPSISVKPNMQELAKKEKKIYCNHDAISLIFENNLQKPIEEKYNVKILRRGLDILISYDSDDTINKIEAELQDWIKKFTFDDGARWAYLENDGSYRLYDQEANQIIEQTFRSYYYNLISPGYKNYSKNAEINATGVTYVIEFSYIGGVHRQKRKNVHQDTIRAVKRQANGEDINSNYVRNYKWLWKHEGGQFMPYEDDAMFLMENSYIEYQNNTLNSIALIQGCNGKTYKIDFGTMTQFNEITNFKRPIRRETV